MGWPHDPGALVELQLELAARADAAQPWRPGNPAAVGGCFVAYATGQAGPGHPGDRAWAAAVAWLAPYAGAGGRARSGDLALKGATAWPRRAADVAGQAVVEGTVPAAYAPGLLALREGEILDAAVRALEPRPDVLLVDATGLDHPRGAGLAVHLGAEVDLPTVGVTRRPLLAAGEEPPLVRGRTAPVVLGGRVVGHWVCTRTGARPVVAHAAWRTDPETAAETVVMASTEGAVTPVPLQEARRVAREARSLGERAG
ncbi:MAG TPA: endonuclease V [Acidimicrobiales bacterium]|nr:endonuclease V [Acidimicrobiales bacterium]